MRADHLHTCLRRCTKRPRVETKATENSLRPCFACLLWLLEGGVVSGLRVSNSASTWPNMSCSSCRLVWSPLTDATDEPFNSELWDRHCLELLDWLWIFPKKKKKTYNCHLVKIFWHIITQYKWKMLFQDYLNCWDLVRGSGLEKAGTMDPLCLTGFVGAEHVGWPLWRLALPECWDELLMVIVLLVFLRKHIVLLLPVWFGALPSVDGVAVISSLSVCSAWGLLFSFWINFLLEYSVLFCRLALQKHRNDIKFAICDKLAVISQYLSSKVEFIVFALETSVPLTVWTGRRAGVFITVLLPVIHFIKSLRKKRFHWSKSKCNTCVSILTWTDLLIHQRQSDRTF